MELKTNPTLEEDFIAHIEKFDDIVRELAAYDMVLCDDIMVVILTKSLPKEFAKAILIWHDMEAEILYDD